MNMDRMYFIARIKQLNLTNKLVEVMGNVAMEMEIIEGFNLVEKM
jgi:hypothetical protein